MVLLILTSGNHEENLTYKANVVKIMNFSPGTACASMMRWGAVGLREVELSWVAGVLWIWGGVG